MSLSRNYKNALMPSGLMIIPNKEFLTRYMVADLKINQLPAPNYFTHLKLSCQPIREAASHTFVLSIIPPR
jgi:hypothetical protein